MCLPSASPPLPAPLRPPVPRTSSGTWGSAADPHIPAVLQTRGRSRGEGVRARDRLLISGVSRGTKGSGRPMQARPCQSADHSRHPLPRRPSGKRTPEAAAEGPVLLRCPPLWAGPPRGGGRAPTPGTARAALTDRLGAHALSPSGGARRLGELTSLGVQWLQLPLPMQRVRVRSWSGT